VNGLIVYCRWLNRERSNRLL